MVRSTVPLTLPLASSGTHLRQRSPVQKTVRPDLTIFKPGSIAS